MLSKALSYLASSLVLLGGDGYTGPAPVTPLPDSPSPIVEEIVLYQTDEIVIEATNFTYAASVSFDYTITNKTDEDLNFSLPNTRVSEDDVAVDAFKCKLKAGSTSKSLTFIQPESTYRSGLKLQMADFDEYGVLYNKIGKILTIYFQTENNRPADAELVYDGEADVYKSDGSFFIDTSPNLSYT